MSTRPTAWLVSVGDYSDYRVLAVALTEAEAQAWADAYNSARESLYRDEAIVEDAVLYRDGDPLPRLIPQWNADVRSEWRATYDPIAYPGEPRIQYNPGMHGGSLAVDYPTREEARAAADAANTEGQAAAVSCAKPPAGS